MTPKSFANCILRWYDQHGRTGLPWREGIEPYKVWVSEIMLQQTQVATVIPYFDRFIKRFPTINDLAKADENEVLHYWSGLGYYARGRNLLKCARVIEQRGSFPATLEDIMALPGIGRSTAGAILSIAFGKAVPILDGNVKRVLCRYAGITEWSGVPATHDYLWQLATQYTPTKRADDYAQAMMDLGATLCTRSKPQCADCPLQKTCVAHLTQQEHIIPVRKPKKTLPVKEINWLILQNKQGEILLEKRPPAGIWGSLWNFPETQNEDIFQHCKKEFALSVNLQEQLPIFRHTFSHYHLDITPFKLHVTGKDPCVMESAAMVWHNPCESFQHGLAAPTKKILEHLQPKEPL